MEKTDSIWCIIAKSRIKGIKGKFNNPIILCAYKTLDEARERIKRLNLEDDYLEWEYTLESTLLHYQSE